MAPTPPLYPRPIYSIALVMFKIFLIVSSSARRVYGGDVTQKGTRGTRIKDRGERGAVRKILHQALPKFLERGVNVWMS